MPKKRKSIQELIEEEKRLREQLAKKRQKLKALKKRVQTEYRKREASFLIGIGRTLLKHGKEAKDNMGNPLIVLPLNALVKAFKEYSDIVEVNEDFRKWTNIITGGLQQQAEGKEKEGGQTPKD